MNEEQIKALIDKEVEKQLKEAKRDLYQKIENKLLYTGEFAKARRLIDAVHEWAFN